MERARKSKRGVFSIGTLRNIVRATVIAFTFMIVLNLTIMRNQIFQKHRPITNTLKNGMGLDGRSNISKNDTHRNLVRSTLGFTRTYGSDLVRSDCVKHFPRVIFIGIPKCGAAALLNFLRFHPNIATTMAELNYFSRHYELGNKWYLA